MALLVLIVLLVRAPTPLMACWLSIAVSGGLIILINRTGGPDGVHTGAVIDWFHVSPHRPMCNVADV